MRNKIPTLLLLTALTLGFLATATGCGAKHTGRNEWGVTLGYTLRAWSYGPADGTEGSSSAWLIEPRQEPDKDQEQKDGE